MYLTLEVVSPQAASLGADRRRTVGPAGLTIGRLPGNDWVIPDDYISKHHARITFADGTFLVEGLGRNPLAIGSPDNIIPNHQPRALRGGDRLFIDQYEVRVAVVQGELPGSAPGPVAYDPFGIIDASAVVGAPSALTPPAIPRGSPGALVPEPWDSNLSGGIADTAELDPLNALGGAAPHPAEPLQGGWQGASPLAEHFEPPAVRPAAPAIDPNWRDNSVMAGARPSPAQPSLPRQQAAPRPGPVIDPNWQDRSVIAGVRPASVQPPNPPRQPVPTPGQQPRPRLPSRERPAPEMARPASPPLGPQGQAAAAAPARHPAMPPSVPSSVVAKSTALPGDLAELLRGAGLSEHDLSPEMLRELGQVLRVVVQGVMEVLRARDEIKTHFRLPLTRVQAVENNPLKRCPNVQGALHTLLVEHNPGYLATVPAFEDAFASIRGHQMAMLEGLRVAFESMLKSFDPKELAAEFEKSGRGGLLGLGGKARYWDLYVEKFSRLGSDPDDVFRRLFGDVFAEAYEQQLERLKSLRS